MHETQDVSGTARSLIVCSIRLIILTLWFTGEDLVSKQTSQRKENEQEATPAGSAELHIHTGQRKHRHGQQHQ